MIVFNPSSYCQRLFFLFLFLFLLLTNSTHATSPAVLGACGDSQISSFRSIQDIQDHKEKTDTYISPLVDQWVIVEGIVSLDLQGQPEEEEYRGFWLQQEGQSFAGVFVYHARTQVKLGQRVRLLAQVSEYKQLTELKRVKALKVCAQGQKIPKAIKLTLPVKSINQLEALEGMRIYLSQPLLVSDLYGAGYGLGNYGQFGISSQRHFQPTELYSAKALLEGKAELIDKKLDYLLIDDGKMKTYPSHIPFPSKAGFSATNPLRIGDRISYIEGILHGYGEHYILIPDTSARPVNIVTQARPLRPVISPDANLVIASMNLRNYFNGSPSPYNPDIGFPTQRGAASYLGFQMQREKIVAGLLKIDADILTLMELENDGYGPLSAIADLTRNLNENLSLADHYHYVIPKQLTRGKLGRDEISIGILYRKAKITAVGDVKVLNSETSAKKINRQGHYSTIFNDAWHRPSLLQTFIFKGKPFVVAVNHFKSKGRPCDSAKDPWQGFCNKEREKAALALADFIRREQLDRFAILITGDLNSYSQEDPLQQLYNEGYQRLKTDFSYSFQGYLGNLDHMLVNDALLPHVVSIDSWHINSVEDSLLDYQTEENGQAYPSIDHYAEPDAYRSSDHDPLVLGLKF